MTQENKEGGLAAEKKSTVVKAKLIKLAELLISLVTISVWFTAVLLLAAGWGQLIHYFAEVGWLSGWKVAAGHIVENVIFVGDCISLVYAVFKELWDHVLKQIVFGVRGLLPGSKESEDEEG